MVILLLRHSALSFKGSFRSCIFQNTLLEGTVAIINVLCMVLASLKRALAYKNTKKRLPIKKQLFLIKILC